MVNQIEEWFSWQEWGDWGEGVMQSLYDRLVSASVVLVPLIGLVVLVSAAYFLIWWPPRIGAVEGLTSFQIEQLTEERRRSVIQALGAIAVAFGLYLTYRRIRASEKRADSIEEGQVTERFSRAVEQLSSADSSTRIGGIYSLERIAGDSKKDHPTVMEIICAYVREKSSSEFALTLLGPEEPSTDVQAACDVICRLSRIEDVEHPLINLNGAKLENVKFDSGAFSYSSFQDAHLRDATVLYFEINHARFRNADLTRAHFYDGEMRLANFFGAKLDEARFQVIRTARDCTFFPDSAKGVKFYDCDLTRHFFQ